MNVRLCCLVVAGALVSVQGFAAKEKVFRFQNHVRVGYDDNVNSSAKGQEVDTAFITEIAQLTGKMVFSSRSELVAFWQPEFRYRFDTDPKMVTYQDLYGRFDHALSQTWFLTVSDRFRYQDREGQTSGNLSKTNQNYMENDLQGALSATLNPKNQIRLGAGYMLRTWDDDVFGEDQGNNFDRISADASYVRQLFGESVDGMLGVNYSDLSYDGERGGLDTVALLLGTDNVISKTTTGYWRLGYQMSDVDVGGTSNDSSNPYLDAGLDYDLSGRTSFNGNIGYKMARSENSYYNAQDKFNIGLGVRHDITAKINLAATLGYIYGMYDAKNQVDGVNEDASDNYLSLGLRGTYQINRNNFVELGYVFNNRSADSVNITEFDRNRIDLGWKLRL